MQYHRWILRSFVASLLLRMINGLIRCQEHKGDGCIPPLGGDQQSDIKMLEMTAVDKFKSSLLKRLGYEERPESRIPLQNVDVEWIKKTLGIYDKEVEASEVKDEAADNLLQTEIFFPLADHSSTATRRKRFISFDLTDVDLETHNIEKGSLRIFIKYSQDGKRFNQPASHVRLMLYVQIAASSKFNPVQSQMILSLVSPHSHWMDINLSKLLKYWKYDNARRLFIRVQCMNCKGSTSVILSSGDNVDKERHYVSTLTLQLKLINIHGLRKKRAAEECLSVTDLCCRRSFVLRFSEIGWDDWVIYPKHVNIGYCFGSCRIHKTFKPMSGHASLIRSVQVARSTDMAVSCCTPTKFSSIEIIQFSDRKVTRKRFDDLIVERCGCS